jgi:hypothetical protein
MLDEEISFEKLAVECVSDFVRELKCQVYWVAVGRIEDDQYVRWRAPDEETKLPIVPGLDWPKPELEKFYRETQRSEDSLINKLHDDWYTRRGNLPRAAFRWVRGRVSDEIFEYLNYVPLMHPIESLPTTGEADFLQFVPATSVTCALLLDDPLDTAHMRPVAAAVLCFPADCRKLIRSAPVLRAKLLVLLTQVALAQPGSFKPWPDPQRRRTFDDFWNIITRTRWGHTISDGLVGAGKNSGQEFFEQARESLSVAGIEEVKPGTVPKASSHPRLYAAYESMKGCVAAVTQPGYTETIGYAPLIGTVALVMAFVAKTNDWNIQVPIEALKGTSKPQDWLPCGDRGQDRLLRKAVLHALFDLFDAEQNCHRVYWEVARSRQVFTVEFPLEASLKDLRAAVASRRAEVVEGKQGTLMSEVHRTSSALCRLELFGGIELQFGMFGRPAARTLYLREERTNGENLLVMSFTAMKHTEK